MKNIRKIVAIMAAVLMLCAAIPMGALSVAAADVIIDYNFDDGIAHFERGYVENGYMVFDATTANWQNAYLYANAMKANTDYVVTFKAKADKDASLIIKINNNWAGDTFESPAQSVTTEWQDFELTINSGALTSTALFLFYAPYPASNAPIFCIDDLKVAEYVEPVAAGTIINGDFETGDTTGWNLPQQGGVSAEAAHDGSYGVNIKGNGGWGGMLDQTIPVNAGKAYEITFWLQINATGVNFQIKDGNTSGANIASDWVDMNKAGSWTQFTFVVRPTQDTLTINFCGSGSAAEDAYVDSFTCTELVDPSFDGHLYNGDFEVGDLTNWNHHQSTTISTDAHSGSYAANIKGNGGWGGMLDQNATVEAGKTYKVSIWMKTNANGANVQLKDGGTSGNNLESKWFTATEWTNLTWEVTPTTNVICFNFCGGGNGSAEDVLVDDITVTELKDPSFDGYLYNGDFETDGSWVLGSGATIADGVLNLNNIGLWSEAAMQSATVKANTKYEITWKSKRISGTGAFNLFVMDASNGNLTKVAGQNWMNETSGNWVENSYTIDTGASEIVKLKFSTEATNPGQILIDDIKITEMIDPSFDGYITNGDFETGRLAPWSDANGKNIASIVEGHNGGSAMQITGAGQWSHIRQEDIAVDPDSTYRLTAYVKGAQNMAFVIKTGDDEADMTSHSDCIFPAGDEWQKVTLEFETDGEGVVYKSNGQPYDLPIESIDILVIAYEAGGEVIIDDITLEKVVCEHEYDDCNDADCNKCGETREPGHKLTYVPAVVPANCQETGHNEYWECSGCDAIFGDAEGSYQLNPAWINYTGECPIPEGLADCADWTCELCGAENIGEGEHDTGVPACQTGTCSKCGEIIEGYGCQNYDTPACEDGVCYYCGGFVAGFGHENGAWAACCDGECTYGCGLVYPATEDHVDETHPDENGDVVEGSDGFCDTCWTHLAHIDEDGDNFCDVCYNAIPEEPPVEDIAYGDVNGDGGIDALDAILLQQYLAGWEVELGASANVNGDESIDALDAILLQQYLAGWEVEFGPV